MSDIGVVYIARGKDPNWEQRLARFARSYVERPAGIAHQVYIIYKEFESSEELGLAQKLLEPLHAIEILQYVTWNSWGGGCFQEACNHVAESLLCTLVSTTEIMHSGWLAYLFAAFTLPNTGLVGCTGSHVGHLHIRDTAIIVRTDTYRGIVSQFDYKTSKDGYLDFEHGPNNFTQQILRDGKRIWVVEQNRVISHEHWPVPTTYQGNLANVLVHDRGARDFNDL